MQVQFFDTSESLWTEILQEFPHDFYHLPNYLQLEAKRIQAVPEAVLVQDGDKIFFLPYLLRQWSGRVEAANAHEVGWDIVSPYGYPGFVVAVSARSDFIQQAMLLIQQAWSDRNICSAFLRLHPILNAGVEDLIAAPALQVNGGTVSIDLTPTLDQLWNQTRENHRRGIRRLKQTEFSVAMAPIDSNLDHFISIYEETMDRVEAKPSYYFSRDYFTQLIQALESKIHLCVAQIDQTIVAAALVTECNGIVQYHLGGTLNRFLKEAPMKLIFDYVRSWAKERGNHVFHLGGGLGAAQDSLYNFKLGFANQIHPFSTLRLIINEAQYLDWVTCKAEQYHQTSDQLLQTNFFPAYRALA